MRVWGKEERNAGSTNGNLVPGCNGRSDSLAVGGTLVLILAATCSVDSVCGRGVEVGAKAGLVYIEDGVAG